MSRVNLLREIIKVYNKHGWTLRGLLLTEDLQIEAKMLLSDFLMQKAQVETAQVNAIWFSRAAGNREAWELRLIQSVPYALFETFDQNTPEVEIQSARRRMEQRLLASKPQISRPNGN